MNEANYKIIDGLKCYNPELAVKNNNFQKEGFELLHKIEENNFWFKSRNRIISRLFEKYLGTKEKKDVMEIGCGTGFVLKGLSKFENYKLTGAEIHLEGLKFAKKRLSDVEFIQLDATNLPFENDFDAIGIFDVIEHIDEDELVLKNIFKALRSNGKIFITVPQHQFMWSRADDIAFHKRRYSKKELTDKVRKQGFKIEYVGSFVTSLFPVMFLSRMLQRSKINEDNTDINKYHEFRISPVVNKIFEKFMKIDEIFINSGSSLPFGGSLILVASKNGK